MSARTIDYVASIAGLDLRMEAPPKTSPIQNLANMPNFKEPLYEVWILPGERGRDFSPTALAKGVLCNLREVLESLANKSPRGEGLRTQLRLRSGIPEDAPTSFYYAPVEVSRESQGQVISIVFGDRSSVEYVRCLGYREHGIFVID